MNELELLAERVIGAMKKHIETRMSDLERRVVAIVDERVSLIPAGKDGQPGKDGPRGADGIAGKDGRDGINGKDGANGRDGTSVTLEAVQMLVDAAITKAVAALPPAPPGRDGKDGAPGVDGKDGLPGRDGKDGVDGVAGKDGLPGKDGAPGKDGKDGAPGRDGVNGEDGAAGIDGKDGATGRDGINGKDGAPGKDGERGPEGPMPTVDLNEVVDLIKADPELVEMCRGVPGRAGADGRTVTVAEVAEAMRGQFATWALEFERIATDRQRAAVDSIPLPRDGRDGKDGKPGIGLDDFEIRADQVGDRAYEITLEAGGRSRTFSLSMPALIDRGIYDSAVTRRYERGDVVTYGSNLWIAQVDEPKTKPGEGTEWRLAVRRPKA